jgi:hypothetical protein
LTPFFSAYLSQPQEMADRRSLGHFSSHSLTSDSSPTSGRSHPGECDSFSSHSTLGTIRLTVFSGNSNPGFFCDNFRSITETIILGVISFIITTSGIGLAFCFDNDGALQTPLDVVLKWEARGVGLKQKFEGILIILLPHIVFFRQLRKWTL